MLDLSIVADTHQNIDVDMIAQKSNESIDIESNNAFDYQIEEVIDFEKE